MLDQLVLRLTRLAEQASKRAEIFVAALVIAIVLMLVLPLPLWLLDILIALNLCAAGLMVVVSMYMPGPTAFSTFPAVLLLTTLFRLALEVSTTRQILLEADAGHIVETFGNFVVGGNLVVGLVVFLILTVVQFIVITKGSERVSEVSARFSLDAMPGKQMSIDSDLRSGILTPEEAKAKRALLGKESQLHGAMDGAMKFVKGDAIAGIFIMVVNLVGGIAIGVLQKNLAAADAMRIYSVLSIGDALIAQIPALLIALAAGMITTRIPDDDHGPDAAPANIGQDIVRELFAEPKALLTAAVIMLLFAMIPGMPAMVFLTLSLLLGTAGAIGLLRPSVDAKQKIKDEDDAKRNAKIVDLTTFEPTKPFVVRMAEDLRDQPAAAELVMAVRIMRNNVLEHYGVPDLQPIAFEYSRQVPSGRVHFLMAEVPLLDVPVRSGWAATVEKMERLQQLGIEATQDPVVGSRRERVWIKCENEEMLVASGIRYLAWEKVLAADIQVEMMRNCQMFVGVHEVQRFTRWADRRFPELGKELTKTVTLPRLTEVVQRLTREGVSLRNARLLLETVLEWAGKERDADVIADYVRLAFKRQLCHEVARDGLIEVVLLSPELEDKIRSGLKQNNQGAYLDIDPELEQQILTRLGALSGTGGTPAQPPVLVAAADIRRPVRKLLEEEFFAVSVFSYAELSQHARIQPVGMIEC